MVYSTCLAKGNPKRTLTEVRRGNTYEQVGSGRGEGK
jgi:hypothetical protein